MKKLLIILALFSINALATPVNINKADAKTIADSLHNIGMSKAEAIVTYREKNGDFKTLEDVHKVKGIGDKTIEKNKADILFQDANATAPAAAAPVSAPANAAPPAASVAPTAAPPAKTGKDK